MNQDKNLKDKFENVTENLENIMENLVDSSSTSRKILNYLSEKEEPETRYSIEQNLDVSYTSIHENMKKLEKGNFVYSEEDGKTRAGLEKKKYGITWLGLRVLVKILLNVDGKFRKVKEMVKKNEKAFPLISDKLDFLEENELLHDFLDRNVKLLVESIANNREDFYEDIIKEIIVENENDLNQLMSKMESLSKDEDFKKVVLNSLKDIRENYRSRIETMEEVLNAIENK